MKIKSICPRCKRIKSKKNRYCRKCVESKFEIVAFCEKNKETTTTLHRKLMNCGFSKY